MPNLDIICSLPETDPDCVCWLRRFNKAFAHYPKKIGAHWISGLYVDRDTANTLKEFIQGELSRLKRKNLTGEAEIYMDIGNYNLSTSLSKYFEEK